MARIKELDFHIKGTPDYTTTDQHAKNYINASLGYDKGKGYFWSIYREGRYTWHDDEYGDRVMRCFTLGDKAPSLWEYLVPCNRAGKAREREAIELFESNVISAITHRLGYEIDDVEKE